MKKRIISLIVVCCIFVSGCQKYEYYKMKNTHYFSDTEYVLPTDEEMTTIYPLSYDMELATQKGLAKGGKLTDKFFVMQQLYREGLEEFLSQYVDFTEFDDEIKNSEFVIEQLDEEDRVFYQNTSTLGCDYIYIRNNLRIEVLAEEDLELLETTICEKDLTVTDEILELVEQTYESVLYLEDEVDTVAYERTHDDDRMATNGAVVVEIAAKTNIYDDEGNIVKIEGVESRDRYEMLEKIGSEIEKAFADSVSVPVECIIYIR